MNDIELTAAAARAAGYNIEPRENGSEFAIEREGRWFPFVPLDDDGDAFRLLVVLNLRIEPVRMALSIDRVAVSPSGKGHIERIVPYGSEPAAAWRRAIVETAAALEADK